MRLTLLVLLFAASASASTQFQGRVAATTDDAYLDIKVVSAFDSTIYTNDAASGYMGRYDASYKDEAGLRFLNVTVPKDATIDSAWLAWTSVTAQSGTTCKLRYYGEDTASAATFSTAANWKVRILTGATVDDDAVASFGVDGSVIRSPELKTIIAEITSRSDWVSGNNLVIFVKDNGSSNGAYRQWEPAEEAGTTPTQLNIWYTESGGPSASKKTRRLRDDNDNTD